MHPIPDYPESVRRKLARSILRGALRMKRGENLIIETWSGTLPWAESLVLEARILGVRPLLWVEDEATYWKSLDEAPEANLGQVGSHEWASIKEAHGFVHLWGPGDAAREDARSPRLKRRIEAVDHEFFRLTQKYHVRMVRWDLGRTSEQWAQRYGVNLEQWRNELIEATTYDSRKLSRDGLRVAGFLQRGKEVIISHPNGTDLRLRLAHRVPKVDDGVVDDADIRSGNVWTVVPSGDTMVTVDEKFAEGKFVANTPGVMFYQEREIPLPACDWTFREGRLVAYSFATGGEEFLRVYPKLGVGKERPGLLTVGLNPRISSIPLVFDQERGRITLAVGRNSYHGGATHSPRFTAYQSLRGATLRVDGKTLVDAGKLV